MTAIRKTLTGESNSQTEGEAESFFVKSTFLDSGDVAQEVSSAGSEARHDSVSSRRHRANDRRSEDRVNSDRRSANRFRSGVPGSEFNAACDRLEEKETRASHRDQNKTRHEIDIGSPQWKGRAKRKRDGGVVVLGGVTKEDVVALFMDELAREVRKAVDKVRKREPKKPKMKESK